MTKNYLEELKELIDKFRDKGFEWGKPIDYLEFRNGCSKEEMEKEILDYSDTEYVEKQRLMEETSYKLYFIYSSKTGRVYVLRFTTKIRVITVYPLSGVTIKKYKRNFKKL
jgi:hypothetical protein